MRDRRWCTQSVIVQQTNLPGPFGEQLIGNVRTDEARTTGEQIDILCQMDLLGPRPRLGRCPLRIGAAPATMPASALSGTSVNVYTGILKFKPPYRRTWSSEICAASQ
jgi:hypothetical protein